MLESSGMFTTIKLLREGKFGSVTGRKMGQLVRALDREQYKEARRQIDEEVEGIRLALVPTTK